jgi:hypothetical protein
MKRTSVLPGLKFALLITTFFLASLSSVPGVFAQCFPLTSGECRDTVGVDKDWSFNQPTYWWSVVGVVPTLSDDKDIYLFSGCGGTGSYLAGSGGTNGTDFIVGDFNHNPLGSYYPRVQYGSNTDPYTVFWSSGSKIFPVSAFRLASLGGTLGTCDIIDIWDIYLELGSEYEFRFSEPPSFEANLSLFRNPGATPYWAGRGDSEFEMTGSSATHYYAPTATDWYGVVVFPTWREFFDTYSLEIEKLFDCLPMTSRECTENVLYNQVNGPADNYVFEQVNPYWSVVAVIPTETDYKGMSVFTECDESGASFGFSSGSTGETSFIVSDFNHSPPGTYFPVVSAGATVDTFTLEWEQGSEVFPTPGDIVEDFFPMESTNPNIVQIWDVYMEAGKQYEFFFYEWGDADPHLALFRNATTSDYWAPRSYAEWEITGSGGNHKSYSPPATDYYGLVAFANTREEYGLYQVRFQELNDCTPLTSGDCIASSHFPQDFSFQTTGNYWAVVGFVPGEEDFKHLHVATQCDQKGTFLASSQSYLGASFVVGDFNHTATGTYYASSYDGDSYETYQVVFDAGIDINEDVLPVNEVVTGVMDGNVPDCGSIKIWDVMLESGTTYTVSFTRSGHADIKLALFANPGSGTYWAGRSSSEWEMDASGNLKYTATTTDWYGVVVFANNRFEWGSYTIRFTPEGVTSTETLPTVPERFALYQNAPNPFNPTTLIRYDVPADGGNVSLKVFDVSGRLVRVLYEGIQSAGQKSVTWDGKDDSGIHMPTGVYFCRLETVGFSETRKMILMK